MPIQADRHADASFLRFPRLWLDSQLKSFLFPDKLLGSTEFFFPPFFLSHKTPLCSPVDHRDFISNLPQQPFSDDFIFLHAAERAGGTCIWVLRCGPYPQHCPHPFQLVADAHSRADCQNLKANLDSTGDVSAAHSQLHSSTCRWHGYTLLSRAALHLSSLA